MARPTKYTEEMQSKADEYVTCYESQGDVIPSVAGLCCYVGVSRATIYNWADIYPEFLDTLSKISENQEATLLNKGLNGDFAPTLTKLVLAGHGYSDRQEIDHSSTDKTMSPSAIHIVAPNVD